MMRSDIQFIQQPEIDVHHYERGDTVRLTWRICGMNISSTFIFCVATTS